jgi:DNA replication protein DnaC
MYEISKLAPTIRHYVLKATLPMKTIGMEFSDLDNSKAKEVTESWCDTVRSGMVIKRPGSPSSGLGLLLVGEPGHGKTTLAATALQSLIRTMPLEANQPGLFMDYPKFLRLEKESWTDEESKAKLREVYGDAKSSIPLFVLDDLGKEYRTQAGWSENTFDALLRSRFNAGLPTIITTNVPLSKWRGTYGEAMESFAHEAFVSVHVESDLGDRRK